MQWATENLQVSEASISVRCLLTLQIFYAQICEMSRLTLLVVYVLKRSIIASFTVERHAQNNITKDLPEEAAQKPLRGIMTNYGYALPDPILPNRKSIWFTGGTIEPADDDEDSIKSWKNVFGMNSDESDNRGNIYENSTDSNFTKSQNVETERARHLASNILLGAISEPMEADGTVGFHLRRPIGGHGSAFVDIVYMDDDIRVMRGHSGSIYVFKKVWFDDQ